MVALGMRGTPHPVLERLLRRLREDAPLPLAGRDAQVEAALAAAFVAAAAALALLGHSGRDASVGEAVVLVAAYALASRVQFGVGAGYTVPTQLAFVPMLFRLPLELVPALVALAILIGNLPDYVAGRTNPGRALLGFGDAWHSLAPALVLLVAGAGPLDAGHWPLYAVALAAQLATDAAVSTLRELGRGPRPPLEVLAWVYLVDVLLTPPALLAAGAPLAPLAALPLVGLLALFARERDGRIDAALELSQAYRGTAMLLGDVLEDTDEYTGRHSKGVVFLAVGVADVLELDEQSKRKAEFGALLHDVGKIAIPPEIVNKPGPLDDHEWRVMRTHTIEGHRMLERVGGLLAEVGAVVRASHERWDGRGYPDGLAGDEIPIEASIVSCCDAFDAMTTDRCYRPAMPRSRALTELLVGAGSQFRPDVVDALVRVLPHAPGERLAAVADPPHRVAA